MLAILLLSACAAAPKPAPAPVPVATPSRIPTCDRTKPPVKFCRLSKEEREAWAKESNRPEPEDPEMEEDHR